MIATEETKGEKSVAQLRERSRKEEELVTYFKERTRKEAERKWRILKQANRGAKLVAEALGLHPMDGETAKKLNAVMQEQSQAMKEEWERFRADRERERTDTFPETAVDVHWLWDSPSYKQWHKHFAPGFWMPILEPEIARQVPWTSPGQGKAKAVWTGLDGTPHTDEGHDTGNSFTVDIEIDAGKSLLFEPTTAGVQLVRTYRIPGYMFHCSGVMHIFSRHVLTGCAKGESYPVVSGTACASVTERIDGVTPPAEWKAYENDHPVFMDKLVSDPFSSVHGPGHVLMPVKPGDPDVTVWVFTTLECQAVGPFSKSELHADHVDLQAGILAVLPI